jgi:magnesium-transporting ATPase (P-type)
MRKRHEFSKLYVVGQEGQIFTNSALAWWVFKGFIHALMVFFITYAAYNPGIFTADGKNTDLRSFSIIELACTIFIVNLELALNTRSRMLLMSIWVLALGLHRLYACLPIPTHQCLLLHR